MIPLGAPPLLRVPQWPGPVSDSPYRQVKLVGSAKHPRPVSSPSVAPPLLAQKWEAGRTDDRPVSKCAGITKLNSGSNYGKFGGKSS